MGRVLVGSGSGGHWAVDGRHPWDLGSLGCGLAATSGAAGEIIPQILLTPSILNPNIWGHELEVPLLEPKPSRPASPPAFQEHRGVGPTVARPEGGRGHAGRTNDRTARAPHRRGPQEWGHPEFFRARCLSSPGRPLPDNVIQMPSRGDEPPPPPPPSEPQFDDLPAVCNTGDLLKLRLRPTQWLMRPYIPRGGIFLLYGKFGTNKTPIATEIALAVQDGRPLWGNQVTKGRVLFVQADTPSQIYAEERLKPLVVHRGTLDMDVLYCYPGFDIVKCATGQGSVHEMEMYTTLRGLHEANQYDLVMIDSLQSMHTLPDIETQSASIVYRTLAETLTGAAVGLIHHSRKTGDPNLPERESFAGNNAWMNRATSAIHVTYRNEADNEVRLTHVKCQASAQAEEIFLRVERNITHYLGDIVGEVMRDPKWEAAGTRAVDEELARRLRCSIRTAQRRRLDWIAKSAMEPEGVSPESP